MTALPESGLRLRSTVTGEGMVRLSLDRGLVAPPQAGEVLVRMAAAPIHPADLMVLFAGADLAEARRDGAELLAPLSPGAQRAAAGRTDKALSVGLEGAGTVVAAGEGAQHLQGASVAVLVPGLGAYAEYCTVPAESCLMLPERIAPEQGAAAFTNPLTALAMGETLRQTGERAMVHTAAASSIGQMLVRICAEDGIDLVNVVRRSEQAEMLRSMGAQHVCDSSAADYRDQLETALSRTGARVAFDAIGGGETAATLLVAMETAATRRMEGFSAYGSAEMKRVYLYGRLDHDPTVIPRGAYGMLWSVEGWAMPPILDRAGSARRAELMRRIADGLDTTFACTYGGEIALEQMLEPDVARSFARQGTNGKVLVRLDTAR